LKTIIFVDDDPDLLESMRARLYKHRHDWTMQFLGDGTHAIEAFEKGPIDLIVSDIRMPGMDGGQLFTVLKERYPATIRIVLSGYADAAQALRLTSLAHQYVAKPCNSGEIENIIERCFRLHDLLSSESLRQVVGRIGELPAMPKVYARLQSALATSDVTANDIADIVNTDAAIASKVLQITNSAFFRLRKPIVRIRDAVTYLGFATIRNLVMSAELFARWKMPAILLADVDPDHLQKHAQLVAQACRSLASGKVSPDDAWLAGLVHDIGYWILAQDCPDELSRAIMQAHEDQRPLYECERQIIGASHAEIGAYLLGLWGLPYPIVEAVAMHHTAGSVASHGFDLLATLAVSHDLLDASVAGELNDGATAAPIVDPSYFAGLNAPFDLGEAQRRVRLSVGQQSTSSVNTA
jgi:HD-like signal output (HDOD) protein/ActR/RegA family two-component response regulator